jgi:hypothetical protein
MMRCQCELSRPNFCHEGEVGSAEGFGEGYRRRDRCCCCGRAAASLLLAILAAMRLQCVGKSSFMCTDEGGKVLSNVVSVRCRNTFNCPRHAVPSAEYLPLRMPGHPPSPSLNPRIEGGCWWTEEKQQSAVLMKHSGG